MMREKAKQFLCLTIIALLVLTMMPSVLFESFAETTASGSEVEKIEKFQAKLVRGTDSDSSTTWTPTTNADGHRFVYRISYAFSGVGELSKESVKIRVPKKLIRDRSGKYDDEFDVGVPEERDADENDDFAYREGSGDDKDYYIVYNNREISAAQTGTIEVSYSLKNRVSQYKDMQDSDRFKADIQVDNNGTKVTADAEADPVRINTSVSITGTSKRVPDGYFYRTWQDRWGEKPSDADDYYYLVWEVKSYIKPHSTQPYNFTLDDTFDNGDVVAYKFEGGNGFQKSNTLKDITPSSGNYNERYDYVLTRHKKSTYSSKNKYTVYNHITATVDPVDQVDNDTKAKANASWYYEKPVYHHPTGHFYQMKYGLFFGPSRYLDNNQEYWYAPHIDGTDFTNEEGRDVVTEDSEDISDYTLTEFKAGETNSISKLRYFTYVRGYPYPWTLPEGKTGDDPSDYGKKPVTYKLIDNSVSIDGTQLTKDDYEVSSLSFNVEQKTAEFDEDKQDFVVNGNRNFNDSDVLDFYVQTGTNDWHKACSYNLKSEAFTDVNSLYVASTSARRIFFTAGVTGYKMETSNAHWFTQVNLFPMLTLKNSKTIMNLVKDKTKVKLDNASTGYVYNSKGSEVFQKDCTGSVYIMGVKRESQILKEVVGTRNNKSKKKFTVLWHVMARESYRDNEGRHATGQNGGTFYDLAPKGSSVDPDSIEVRDGETILSESDYTTEIKENYKGSGRDLLIIKIKKPGTDYNFYVNTVHLWENLKELSYNLLNSAVYETGNSKIADGLKDTGGSGADKDLLKDIDPDTDAARFLYSEDWKTADLVTSTTTGLQKKVKAKEDADYSYATTTYPNDDYAYRIRFANDDETKTRNIVFFDSLENYITPEGKVSDWHGTLKGVDTSSLVSDGIRPVVYYSSLENMDIYLHHDLDEVVNGQKVWKTASEFGDISKAKAVAIDCRTASDGSAFTLAPGKIISARLYMHSPISVAGKNAIAYNNIFIDKDSVANNGAVTNDLIHQDYTQLKYRVVADVKLCKVQAENPNKTISGISFRLYGTSDYEDDIDMTAASGSDGTAIFKRVPIGTYKLQELGGSDDWLVDHDQKTVRIDENGLVTISGITAKDGVWQFPDKPRIHGDLKIYKRSTIRSKEAASAIKALKEAGENGNVTIDGTKFTVISYRADKSAVEVKPEKSVIPGDSTPTLNSIFLKTMPSGNLLLSLKTSASLPIEGTSFHLSGTSDYGNDVSVDGTTDTTGAAVLKNIEKGTYTLQETKANEDYILNPSQWTVRIDGSGNASIDDGEQYFDGWILRNEPRYHDFSLRKVDAENTSQWLSGAEFRLQGVSELGTSVDKTAAADDTGLAEFLDLEKGSYILTETKAPEHHQLDAKSYIVTVTAFGDVYVDGLSMDEDGHFTFPDKRTLDGKITITKKWADNKSNDNRPVPKVHLTTKKPWYEKQAYAVYDSGDQSMTFFRDAKGKYTDGQVSGTKRYYTGFEDITGKTYPSWYDSSSGEQKNTIKTVTFKDKIRPKTCYDWFSSAFYLTSITGLDKLDTSRVTNMSQMFNNCSSLTSLDLSSFNTAAVTDMSDMFGGCSSLTSLDLSSFNTAAVTNMEGMFSGCGSLTSLDVSNFNTENVTNMNGMFYGCRKLASLDVSSFNTAAVTNMSGMFNSCSKLTSLDVSSFNTENVTTMRYMFAYCSSLTSLDLSGFNTESVTDMGTMFYSCSSLTSLDLSNFNIENVTTMDDMFMFCSSLTSLDLSSFNTEKVTNMEYMFYSCSNLTSLDLSSFNTENVTKMGSMFGYCSKLKTIYASSLFTTDAVSSSGSMFDDCTSLVGGAGTKFDANHRNKTYARIDGGTSNPGYFTAKSAHAKANLLSVNTDALLSTNSLKSNTAAASVSAPKKVLRAAANTTSNTVTKYSHTPNVKDDGTQNGNYANNLSTNDVVTIPGASKLHVKITYGGESANWDWVSVWQGAHSNYKAGSDYSKAISISGTRKLGGGSHTSSSNTKEFDVNGDSVTFGFKSDGSGVGDGYGYYAVITADVTSEAYAVFDSSDGSFTFFRDTPGKYTDGQVSGTKTYYRGFEDITGETAPSWFDSSSGEQKNTIKTVAFKDKMKPKTCYLWFDNADALTSITGLDKLDTANVTNMGWMFYNCSKLTSLDVSSFNTENVTDMEDMFVLCSSLASLDVSSFNTTNVTSMAFMFYGCSSLTSLDVSSFNTANVTNMSDMFTYCSSLTSLDVSSFNTGKVTNMEYMFAYCSSLTSLDLSSFNTAAVTNMIGMFGDCYNLASLDLSSFNTAAVTNMSQMFNNCYNLASLDLSSFNTAAVTNMSIMFSGCSKLNTLVLGSKFTKTSNDARLGGNWNRIATTSGRKVAKTAAISASTLMSTYDGNTMSGIWQKEGTPESASPIDIYEDYVTDDSKWTKNDDGTWTYTFDVYDDASKFYAYEESTEGYVSSNDDSNYLVVNGSEITKSGVITNTESDYGSLKVSKTVSGDSLDNNDRTKKFGFTVRLTGANISGTQEFGGVIFTDGMAAIALADGEEKTFTNIPEGTTYTVTEVPNAEYTEAITGSTGTIASGKTSEVSAVNTKVVDKNKLTDLAVSKKTEGTAASGTDNFSFRAEFTGLVPGRTYSLVKTDNAAETFTADLIGNVTVSFTMTSGVTKTFKDLPIGAKYRITEEKNSYTPAFTITNADDSGTIRQSGGSETAGNDLSTAFETVDQGEKSTVLFTNTKNKDTSDTRDLVLIKKTKDSSGNATDITLPGAWFNLKGTSDNGEDIDISKKSDSNGRIVFNKLYAGTYTLTEKQAPNGYQKDSAQRTVTVDPEKDPAVTVTGLTQSTDNTFPVYNKPVPTYPVGFLKNDSSGEPVKNAELALFDSDGNRVVKWTTESDMHTENLAEGEYTLKETLVPDGYSKADDITFTIGSGGVVTSTSSDAVQKLTVTNTGDPAYAIKMIDPSSISGLPNTGGMGTKLLYIVGAALIAIGTAAYLRKKK